MISCLAAVQDRGTSITDQELRFLTLADEYACKNGEKNQRQFIRDCASYDLDCLDEMVRKFSFRKEVVDFAVASPNISVKLLLELLKKDNKIAELSISNIQHIAEHHAYRSPKLGDTLIDQYPEWVFESLLAYKWPLPETLEKLYVVYRKDHADVVNTMLFQHAGCPQEIRMKLMPHCQSHVAYALHGNLEHIQGLQKLQYRVLAVEWVSSMKRSFMCVQTDLLFVLLKDDVLSDSDILKKCMYHHLWMIRRLAREQIKNLHREGVAKEVAIQISFSDKVRDFFFRTKSLLA